MTFEWKQNTASVSFKDVVDFTIENRINECADTLMRDLNLRLYGDDPARPPLTRWERARRRMLLYRERISDAWLVLTGQASIGDY